MGNFTDCKCRFRDNKNDNEVNLPNSHIPQKI